MKELHRLQLGIALGALALGACASATVNPASDEQAIRSVTSDWQRAIAARDVNRIVAIHAPDAQVVLSNSPAAVGAAGASAPRHGRCRTRKQRPLDD